MYNWIEQIQMDTLTLCVLYFAILSTTENATCSVRISRIVAIQQHDLWQAIKIMLLQISYSFNTLYFVCFALSSRKVVDYPHHYL